MIQIRTDLQLKCKYLDLGSPQTQHTVDMGLSDPNSVVRIEAYASTSTGSTIVPLGCMWGNSQTFSVIKEAGNINVRQFNPSTAFTKAYAYIWYR